MSDDSLLIVISKSPHASSVVQEGLDLALATASFDQQVALAFEGDGLLCFARDQDFNSSARKNASKTLSALPLFGIDSIFVLHNTKEEPNSSFLEFPDNASAIEADARAEFYKRFSNVLHF